MTTVEGSLSDLRDALLRARAQGVAHRGHSLLALPATTVPGTANDPSAALLALGPGAPPDPLLHLLHPEAVPVTKTEE